MAPVPDPSSSTNTATDALAEEFGANDWLLEEMYEQYVADPGSVDPSWAQYFKTHQLGNGANGSSGNGAAGKASTASAPATAAPAKAQPAAAASAPSKQAPVQSAPPTSAPSTPTKPAPQAPSAPAARRPARVEQPTANKNERPSAPGNRGGVPADPPNPANRPTVDLEEPTRTVLRGAPARTAKNMDASLTVPTATSVRSLPVKLLIDQRVVINNHLRRARGGKVSYTHLIGFAMVQALKTHPAMNNGYEVIDGKPTMVVPQHINLGLAIDMPKPDGTRQLLVPSIKSCENLDFAQFWAAYEEIVKKARSQLADRRGLPGHHHHADQPGNHRHQPLRAPADERAGRHHRRRLDGLPARVPGVGPGQALPDERLQGDDADLDLRPPRHPGRAARVSTWPGCTRCCSARTGSTTTSSRHCGSRTSRSAGPRTSAPTTRTRSPSRPGSSR